MTDAAGSSPYDVLGVTPDATPAELHAAYRRRAWELHPDRVGTDDDARARAGESMRELNDAWRTLQSGRPAISPAGGAARPPIRPADWQPFPTPAQRRHGCAWLAAAGIAALVAGVIAITVVSSSGRSGTGARPSPTTIPETTVSVVCRGLSTRSVANLAQVYWSEDPSHSVAQYETAIETVARQGCPAEL